MIRGRRQPHFLERSFAFGFYEARSRLTATHGHWKVVEIIDRATEISSHAALTQLGATESNKYGGYGRGNSYEGCEWAFPIVRLKCFIIFAGNRTDVVLISGEWVISLPFLSSSGTY